MPRPTGAVTRPVLQAQEVLPFHGTRCLEHTPTCKFDLRRRSFPAVNRIPAHFAKSGCCGRCGQGFLSCFRQAAQPRSASDRG